MGNISEDIKFESGYETKPFGSTILIFDPHDDKNTVANVDPTKT